MLIFFFFSKGRIGVFIFKIYIREVLVVVAVGFGRV